MGCTLRVLKEIIWPERADGQKNALVSGNGNSGKEEKGKEMRLMHLLKIIGKTFPYQPHDVVGQSFIKHSDKP